MLIYKLGLTFKTVKYYYYALQKERTNHIQSYLNENSVCVNSKIKHKYQVFLVLLIDGSVVPFMTIAVYNFDWGTSLMAGLLKTLTAYHTYIKQTKIKNISNVNLNFTYFLDADLFF